MANTKSYFAMLRGIVIILADIYWLVERQSYQYTSWLAAGVVIFVASVVWIYLEYYLMKK